MNEGWDILAPFENLDPALPLPATELEAASARLVELSRGLQDQLFVAIRAVKKHKWHKVLSGGFQPPDENGTLRPPDVAFLNSYFSNEIRLRPSRKGIRFLDLAYEAAFRFQLAYGLQGVLLPHLLSVPTSQVMYSSDSPNPIEFERMYRFIELRHLVQAIKGLQHDMKFQLEVVKNHLASPEALVSVSETTWPFDSDTMYENVMLGFCRAPLGIVNSVQTGSAVLAAGIVRSYMESVLFQVDFHTSLSGRKPLRARHPEVQGWVQAVSVHQREGRLNNNQVQWTKTAYQLLSRSLHGGTIITRGEVWAMGHVVRV